MDRLRPDFFLELIRSARSVAIADAEGYVQALHAFETIGQILLNKVGDFGKYKEVIEAVASKSSLCTEIPSLWPAYHTRFDQLYEEMRRARNDAMHQGARARTLTSHVVAMAIVLEDALLANGETVSQFMVRDVIEAKEWQPISYVRQQMLTHAFSYLPLFYEQEGCWCFVAEGSIARYLRSESEEGRKKKLAKTLGAAVSSTQLQLQDAVTVTPDRSLSSIIEKIDGPPILIVDPERKGMLLGILTAADIL